MALSVVSRLPCIAFAFCPLARAAKYRPPSPQAKSTRRTQAHSQSPLAPQLHLTSVEHSVPFLQSNIIPSPAPAPVPAPTTAAPPPPRSTPAQTAPATPAPAIPSSP